MVWSEEILPAWKLGFQRKKKKALNVYAFIERLPNLKNNSRNSMEVKETWDVIAIVEGGFRYHRTSVP